MKKSLLALIAGTSALALMGTMALAQNVGKFALADGSYSLTINASNIVNTSGNYYNVKTPNGSDFELFFGNAEVAGGTINLALNGAGIYFHSPIQHIISVTVTYTYDTDCTLTLHTDTTKGSFANTINISSSGTAYAPKSGYRDNVYATFWATAVGGSDSEFLRISSLVVNYTCA